MEVFEFGVMPDGRTVHAYKWANANGIEATCLDYGALLQSLKVPDQQNRVEDITLGFDTLEGWLANPSYFGSNVGRFGNRIAEGTFELDGKTYQLALNSETNGVRCHLHGGEVGLNHRLFTAEVIQGAEGDGVQFTYLSPDGEEGYPGNVSIQITYLLTVNNELKIMMAGLTDQATPLNIAHHTYWNLSGDPSKPVLGHEVTLEAESVLEVNEGLIPTGHKFKVEGTPYDFQSPKRVGRDIHGDHPQLKVVDGYDACFVLNRAEGLIPAATVYEPESGRTMALLTNQPGVHFYTACHFDGTEVGKGGIAYPQYGGLCLETEGFPDAPNHSNFPSTILRPGDTYRHVMVHRFSW